MADENKRKLILAKYWAEGVQEGKHMRPSLIRNLAEAEQIAAIIVMGYLNNVDPFPRRSGAKQWSDSAIGAVCALVSIFSINKVSSITGIKRDDISTWVRELKGECVSNIRKKLDDRNLDIIKKVQKATQLSFNQAPFDKIKIYKKETGAGEKSLDIQWIGEGFTYSLN